jgi:hypothetical protein
MKQSFDLLITRQNAPVTESLSMSHLGHPDIERLAFISAGDPDFAELAERIEAGLGPAGTVVGRAEIGAWTTV